MKKLFVLITAAVLSANSICAVAQQGRSDINLYMGLMNASFISLEDNGNFGHSDLYSIYEPYYHLNCYPTVAADYNHRLLNWLGVGIQANYAVMTGSKNYRVGNSPNSDFKQNMMGVLPQVKFYIPSPRHFRLYTKVGVGVNFNIGPTTIGEPISFAYDLVPVGFEWGGQVIFGTAEVCVGNVVKGVKIGLGYRF